MMWTIEMKACLFENDGNGSMLIGQRKSRNHEQFEAINSPVHKL